ncbi:MAG: hypothetical protein IT262_06115 [Saprospiraceae bacterium]|nr:hypothetical protein [Saprospiraceae bacterium]
MEDIAALAAYKSFAELDRNQQEMVLAEMNADAYDQLHRVLCSARALDTEVVPPPGLALRLQAHMAQRNRPVQRERPVARLLQLRIPVWQAAAALLLVFAIGRFWKTTDALPVPAAPLVQTIVKTDTVLLEKILWKERIVLREQPIQTVPVIDPLANIPPFQTYEVPTASPVDPNTDQDVVLEVTVQGAPIGEQPELFQFFTQPGEGGKRF